MFQPEGLPVALYRPAIAHQPEIRTAVAWLACVPQLPPVPTALGRLGRNCDAGYHDYVRRLFMWQERFARQDNTPPGNETRAIVAIATNMSGGS